MHLFLSLRHYDYQAPTHCSLKKSYYDLIGMYQWTILLIVFYQ